MRITITNAVYHAIMAKGKIADKEVITANTALERIFGLPATKSRKLPEKKNWLQKLLIGKVK